MTKPHNRPDERMLDGYHSLTNGYRIRAHIAEARVAELEEQLEAAMDALRMITAGGQSGGTGANLAAIAARALSKPATTQDDGEMPYSIGLPS